MISTATTRATGSTPPGDVDALPADAAVASRRQMLAGAGSLCVLGAGLTACSGSSGSGEPSSDSAPAATGGAAARSTTVIALSKVPVGGAASATLNGKPVVVAQPKKGKVVAFSAVCPHQGGIVAPGDGVFKCPLHSSTFDETTGERLSGPAATGLTEVEVVVDGSNVITS